MTHFVTVKTGGLAGAKKRLQDVAKRAKSLRTTIRNVGSYLARSLHNAPKRAKRKPPNRDTGKNHNYFASRTPNRVFFPTKDGWEDSGLTVDEYLKKIKGGYRAVGAGKRKKEMVQTRVKGTAPAGTYAERNQKPGQFIIQGTGEISREEKLKLRQIHEDRKALRAKQRAEARAELYELKKRLYTLERRSRLLAQLDERRRERVAKKAATARHQLAKRKERLRRRHSKQLAKYDSQNVRYRIVVPSARGFVANPQPATMLRRGAPPGAPPKTWGTGAGYDYYISRTWTHENVDEDTVRVFARPWQSKRGKVYDLVSFFRTLEMGGPIMSSSTVIGYHVHFWFSSRSHKRIAFDPIWSKGRMTSMAGRPFVLPTVMKVTEHLRSRVAGILKTM